MQLPAIWLAGCCLAGWLAATRWTAWRLCAVVGVPSAACPPPSVAQRGAMSSESEISYNDDSDSGSDFFGVSTFEKDWEDLDEEELGALSLLVLLQHLYPQKSSL